MKILYTAFSCNPNRGSESYCGWSWPLVMRNQNDVYVITRHSNQKDIEEYFKVNHIDNISVIYCKALFADKLNLNNRIQYFIYYLLWERKAYRLIKKLMPILNFDYIQHITLGDFRFIGKIHKLKSQFIFGPVGGGQVSPKEMYSYVKKHKFEENIRKLINQIMILRPSYQRALNRTKIVLAANDETAAVLKKVSKKSNVHTLSENGISQEYLLSHNPVSIKEDSSKVILMWSGRLVYRKGLEFLIECIQNVNPNLSFELLIYGSGPEINSLMKKVNDLNLDSKIKFCGSVTYNEMQAAYKKADIFVFPSIRETTGTVLFEAMANSLPVISFNQNGAKLLVNNQNGILINVNGNTLAHIQKDFTQALEKLISDKELRVHLGYNARKWIETNGTWENKIAILNKILESVNVEVENCAN